MNNTQNTDNTTGADDSDKKKRERRPFQSDGAVARFDDATVERAVELIRSHQEETHTRLPQSELALALFGNPMGEDGSKGSAFSQACGYLFHAQLSELGFKIQQGPGGGIWDPNGAELIASTTASTEDVDVPEELAQAIEQYVEKKLKAIGDKKLGVPVSSVVAVLEQDMLCSSRQVNAWVASNSDRYQTVAPKGIVRTPKLAAE